METVSSGHAQMVVAMKSISDNQAAMNEKMSVERLEAKKMQADSLEAKNLQVENVNNICKYPPKKK